MDTIDQIMDLFARKGHGAYFGEAVSETEHALQSAYLAERAGADDCAVSAALLHDIGHLLHGLSEDIAQTGIDAHHEAIGAAWLERHFGSAVASPVRLHVDAKRYLCAVEPDYRDGLSPASLQSLRLQGGPMMAEEIRAFEVEPHFRVAVALRRWDDAAKVPGLVVPGLEHYRPRLAAALLMKDKG